MNDQFSLASKTALVTGGDKGLGQAIALALAEAGADIAVTSRSGKCDDTLATAQAFGCRALAISADFTDAGAPARAVEDAIAGLGGVDILVNNAGIVRRDAALDYGDNLWEEVMAVNLKSVWTLSQLVARHMHARGQGGKIINVASLLAFQGGIRVPAYAASKHAVAGLTKALANEWAALGINVNAIAPGYMRTDNTTALQHDPVRARQILERIPAGRWGEGSDLAGAAVFLASRASDYVHGHVLAVDGGWLAR
jgi:2-deoxy-D-gluconate 3-dehydrogenase